MPSHITCWRQSRLKVRFIAPLESNRPQLRARFAWLPLPLALERLNEAVHDVDQAEYDEAAWRLAAGG